MELFPQGYSFDFEIIVIGSWSVICLLNFMHERGDFNWVRDILYPLFTVDATIVSWLYEYDSTCKKRVFSAVFLTENGKQVNLTVPFSDFWIFVRGCKGKLTYIGSSYFGFALESTKCLRKEEFQQLTADN